MGIKFKLPLGYSVEPDALCWNLSKTIKGKDNDGNPTVYDKVIGYYPTLEMVWLSFVDSFPREVANMQELKSVIVELQKLKMGFQSYAKENIYFNKQYASALKGEMNRTKLTQLACL